MVPPVKPAVARVAALAPLTAGLLVQPVSGAWAVGAFAATMATAALLCLALPGLREAQGDPGPGVLG